VRFLTESEIVVLRSLLQSEPRSEREKIEAAGLPRRTYQVARQRAYAQGWVYDRFIPNPAYFGINYATFAVCRPFSEAFSRVSQSLEENDGTVVLWTGEETIFAVMLHPDVGSMEASAILNSISSSSIPDALITVDLRKASVPVYFDFEAVVATIGNLERVGAYPRSLPSREPTLPTRVQQHANRSTRNDIATLPTENPTVGPEGGRYGPRRLSRTQYRLWARGILDFRTFLDPARFPGYGGRTIGKAVLIRGRLKSGRKAEGLFQTIMGKTSLRPFLYVTDDNFVLLGSSALDPTRPAIPGGGPSNQVVFESFLERIEAYRLPIGGLTARVQQRFNRVLKPTES
jgi:hypothetical protein